MKQNTLSSYGNFQADWWKLQCQMVLTERTLERALGGK